MWVTTRDESRAETSRFFFQKTKMEWKYRNKNEILQNRDRNEIS
jgi:hypothetical protein